MATYFAPTFNKAVAPGASTHHCKTKWYKMRMTENCHHFNTTNKSGSIELMTDPSIHNLNKALNNNIH